MKLLQISFILVVAAFAAVSAHAQCYLGQLNGKYVLAGGGKKVTLNVLGVVDLEQEHNTIGYLVMDGSGNITDGKTDEEIDNTITEHTGLTGTYTLDGPSCQGTLTVQGSGYQRTFNLQTYYNTRNFTSGPVTLLPNGGNGEDEVYKAEKTVDPPGGCSASTLDNVSFSGTIDGGTGGNTTKGSFRTTFNNTESGATVTVTETDIVNGVLRPTSTTTYPAQVNFDCSVEIFSDTTLSTKIGEAQLSATQVPSSASLAKSAIAQPSDVLNVPWNGMSMDWKGGEFGEGKYASW
jgi:hypothetical protein